MLVELKPTNGRKSYGHKAIVDVTDDGKKLYSYETEVCYTAPPPNFKGYRLTEDAFYSNTTVTHIADFLYQEGVYTSKPSKPNLHKDFSEANAID